jgi:SAM-dependent methyltransferase
MVAHDDPLGDGATEHFRRMQERYRTGQMPWHDALPPPEVMAIAERLAPGRALDLGCGAARAAIYLARRGWQVDGVDFVPEAIELAQGQVAAAELDGVVRLHQAAVTHMPFLAPPYDLAVDVGCMHGLDEPRQAAYAGEVARLLRPGARYLLFARLRGALDGDGPGIDEGAVERLFGASFALVSYEPGFSNFGDARDRSAWYELERKPGGGAGDAEPS